ncbi:ABC transporter ATP-binding protein [Acidocella sp. C78]|uniref:ABC transporter ATP-binding protein n=1 Tax=Acidocella sp. C78 TaxID=1671486 RepID=UPI00191B9AAB|nr:ABC transporter ATP-binding protein [Acidocella sp. C78]
MSLLEIADLKVNYGQIEALKGVSLRVESREIVAILGANGAGKTTLMRTISGLLSPRGGSVVFDGTDITRMGADRIVRLGIAQSPEGRRVFGTLSVMENLRLGAFTRPAGEVAGSLDFVLEMFPRLAERRSQLAGTMSGGEQQMLAIGRALMAKPRLLLLDEPSLGLAPIIVQGIFRTLREIADSGVTILIVEQNARSALKLADRGYVLEVGRFVIEDDAKTLLTSPEVQAAYLGGERKKA